MLAAALTLILIAHDQPLPRDKINVGDEVYMIWDWGKALEIHKAQVIEKKWFATGEIFPTFKWPSIEGGWAYTIVEDNALAFRTEGQAKRWAARLLRERAAWMIKQAEKLEKP